MGTRKQKELKDRCWRTLEKERIAMLVCTGVYPKPMTAQIEDGTGTIWFFTSRDNDLAHATTRKPQQGLLTFTSKGHDMFAPVGGTLSQDNDPQDNEPQVCDRHWNHFVSGWYPG